MSRGAGGAPQVRMGRAEAGVSGLCESHAEEGECEWVSDCVTASAWDVILRVYVCQRESVCVCAPRPRAGAGVSALWGGPDWPY